MEQLAKKAAIRAVSKYIENHYSTTLACRPQDLYDQFPGLEKIVEKQKLMESGKYKSTHLFITINPRPDSDFEKFKEAVQKVVTKKWISDYLYCYEQRGTTMETQGEGFHVHMLLPRNGKKPAEAQREIYNTVKKFCSNVKHVDIKPVAGEQNIQNKIDYIKGICKSKNEEGSDKFEKHQIDICWRIEMGLEPFYEYIDTQDDSE